MPSKTCGYQYGRTLTWPLPSPNDNCVIAISMRRVPCGRLTNIREVDEETFYLSGDCLYDDVKICPYPCLCTHLHHYSFIFILDYFQQCFERHRTLAQSCLPRIEFSTWNFMTGVSQLTVMSPKVITLELPNSKGRKSIITSTSEKRCEPSCTPICLAS